MVHYQRSTAKTFSEPAGTIKIVETAGFRSTKQQIEEYMDAGRRLQAYRELKYDFEHGTEVPEDYHDPTRTPGYDPADAMEDLRTAEANLKRSAKTKEDKAQKDKDSEPVVEKKVTEVTSEENVTE